MLKDALVIHTASHSEVFHGIGQRVLRVGILHLRCRYKEFIISSLLFVSGFPNAVDNTLRVVFLCKGKSRTTVHTWHRGLLNLYIHTRT